MRFIILLLLFLSQHRTVPSPPEPSRSEVRAPISTAPASPVPTPCAPTAGEQWIIARESDGDVHAWNPVNTETGHAFGIGQLTDEIRETQGRALGINPNTTNYCDQLRLMRGYIAERYGSTSAAVSHWRARHWY